MKRQRIEKHESLIHQVINEYLIREGKSFLGKEFVTIMGIKLSADLSVALVFISVLDNSKSEFVDQKFDEKKLDIKQFLARSIGKKIRKIPEIKFTYVDQISQVINVKQQQKKAVSLAEEMKNKLLQKRGGFGSTGAQ